MDAGLGPGPGSAGRLHRAWRGAGFGLLLVAAALGPLALHWCAGRTLVWFDSQQVYAPQRWIVDEALRAFRLPLWDPYMGGGIPLFADAIHGVLHPVSVAVAWAGTARSVDLLIAGYVASAALGAALLARDLGSSRAGAAVAAFTFASSGYVLASAGNLVFLAGCGSLPYCVAGLRRFGADPRPWHLAAGALGVALLAFSGDAQGLVVGGALAAVLAFEAAGGRGVVRAIVAGAVGLAIAGVQLLPSAALLPRTLRAVDGAAAAPEVWALEPWRLPELVLPGLFRSESPIRDPVFAQLAGAGHWPAGNSPFPFAQSVFVGLLPLALAAVAWTSGRRAKLLWILAAALLWIALGPALGASAVLGHVPLWRSFRYAEKLVGPLTLVLAVLAGAGLDAIVGRRVSGARLLAIAATLGAAAVAISVAGSSRLDPEAGAMLHARLLRGGGHALAVLAAIGLWLPLRARVGAAASGAAAALLVWAGMAAASSTALWPGDPEARLRAPGPSLDGRDELPRVLTVYEQVPWVIPPGADAYDLLGRAQAARGDAAYNVRWRLDSLSGHAAMIPSRLSAIGNLPGGRWPLVARRYGLTHLLLDPPRTEGERDAWSLATRGATRVGTAPQGYDVWSIPHRPWAAFAPEVETVAGEPEAWSATLRALAEQRPTLVVEAAGRFDTAPGRVRSVRRGIDSLRIEAEAGADGTLVVNDGWWPGWQATVDGEAVTIFRADWWVRAVRWPAGRHVLEMRYRPPEVRRGQLVTAVGVALLAGGWLLLRRRGRAQGSRPAPVS